MNDTDAACNELDRSESPLELDEVLTHLHAICDAAIERNTGPTREAWRHVRLRLADPETWANRTQPTQYKHHEVLR